MGRFFKPTKRILRPCCWWWRDQVNYSARLSFLFFLFPVAPCAQSQLFSLLLAVVFSVTTLTVELAPPLPCFELALPLPCFELALPLSFVFFSSGAFTCLSLPFTLLSTAADAIVSVILDRLFAFHYFPLLSLLSSFVPGLCRSFARFIAG